MYYRIMKFLDEGQYCMSIFVDLTKAFDTVHHEILRDKLDRYGIRGHASIQILLVFYKVHIAVVGDAYYTATDTRPTTNVGMRCSTD